jgi:hypothetical protein
MPPSRSGAIVRRQLAVLTFCLCVCAAASAQQSSVAELRFHFDSDAVETATTQKSVQVEAPSEHRFWDKTNRILFSAVALASAADFAATRNNLQNGGHELNPLTRQFGRSAAGLAVNFAGETVCVVGLSYLFHKTGHHRLERLTSVVDVSMSASAVSYDLTHR